MERGTNGGKKQKFKKILVSQSIHDCWLHIEPSIPTQKYSREYVLAYTKNWAVCVCLCALMRRYFFQISPHFSWNSFEKWRNRKEKKNEHSFGWKCNAMQWILRTFNGHGYAKNQRAQPIDERKKVNRIRMKRTA